MSGSFHRYTGWLTIQNVFSETEIPDASLGRSHQIKQALVGFNDTVLYTVSRSNELDSIFQFYTERMLS